MWPRFLQSDERFLTQKRMSGRAVLPLRRDRDRGRDWEEEEILGCFKVLFLTLVMVIWKLALQ